MSGNSVLAICSLVLGLPISLSTRSLAYPWQLSFALTRAYAYGLGERHMTAFPRALQTAKRKLPLYLAVIRRMSYIEPNNSQFIAVLTCAMSARSRAISTIVYNRFLLGCRAIFIFNCPTDKTKEYQ